jgi:hypothetical protein
MLPVFTEEYPNILLKLRYSIYWSRLFFLNNTWAKKNPDVREYVIKESHKVELIAYLAACS